MSFQLCAKCKGLWTFFGTGAKPEVCPKCAMDEKNQEMILPQMHELSRKIPFMDHLDQ